MKKSKSLFLGAIFAILVFSAGTVVVLDSVVDNHAIEVSKKTSNLFEETFGPEEPNDPPDAGGGNNQLSPGDPAS
ncbi:MAG: hypothetical protein ACFFD4_11870 [Candidatus Odinarchaeota archaeon]